MATYTWTADVSAGILKNHILSAQLREASVVQSLFATFVDAEPGYGRNSGDTLNVTRISAFPDNVPMKPLPFHWGKSLPS